MTTVLRIEMILAAAAAFLIVLFFMKRKLLRVQDSILWLLIAVSMVILSLFTGVSDWLCSITGIELPSNLLYLLGIFALLLIAFRQTLQLSRHSEQLKYLIQIMSIEKYELEEREHSHHDPEI